MKVEPSSFLMRETSAMFGSPRSFTVCSFTAFEKASGRKLPFKIVPRREGDVVSAYANTDKANAVLGWKVQSTLKEALASAWKWEQKIRKQ